MRQFHKLCCYLIELNVSRVEEEKIEKSVGGKLYNEYIYLYGKAR